MLSSRALTSLWKMLGDRRSARGASRCDQRETAHPRARTARSYHHVESGRRGQRLRRSPHGSDASCDLTLRHRASRARGPKPARAFRDDMDAHPCVVSGPCPPVVSCTRCHHAPASKARPRAGRVRRPHGVARAGARPSRCGARRSTRARRPEPVHTNQRFKRVLASRRPSVCRSPSPAGAGSPRRSSAQRTCALDAQPATRGVARLPGSLRPAAPPKLPPRRSMHAPGYAVRRARAQAIEPQSAQARSRADRGVTA